MQSLAKASSNSLVNDWLQSHDANTRRSYLKGIEVFERWSQSEPTPFSGVQAVVRGSQGEANMVVVRYKSWLSSTGLAAATINSRLTSIKSLLKAARMFGWSSNTIEIPNVPSKAYRDTRGPGLQAVKRMYEASSSLRDRALLVLMANNGLRRGEIAKMDWRHVDFGSQSIEITGKGRKQSERISITEKTMHALSKWKSQHPNPGPNQPVFIAQDPKSYGKRLTGRSICRTIKSMGTKANVRATPHGIRHTAITAALDATDGDIRTVQRFSRHVKSDTVSLYDDRRKNDALSVSKLISIG